MPSSLDCNIAKSFFTAPHHHIFHPCKLTLVEGCLAIRFRMSNEKRNFWTARQFA